MEEQMGKTPYTAGEPRKTPRPIEPRPPKTTPGASIRPGFVRAAEPALKALEEVRREVEALLLEFGPLPQVGDTGTHKG